MRRICYTLTLLAMFASVATAQLPQIFVGLRNTAAQPLSSGTRSPLLFDDLRQAFRIKLVQRAFKLRHPKLDVIYTITLDDSTLIDSLIGVLAARTEVQFAERVPVYSIVVDSNDVHPDQWHLRRIRAPLAWDLQLGRSDIRLAIVDDGVWTRHPDLASAIWTNPDEIPNNAVDDDNNGYIDDVNGWDVADNDNETSPLFNNNVGMYTHGTHCAGIAAAATDNGTGIAGMSWGVRVIPVKTVSDALMGGPVLTHPYQGVEYAIIAGADVISMSWGGSTSSAAYQALFDVAFERGIVCVAAAGNNNSSFQFFPAGANHVISVAASDPFDKKAVFSNYGDWIDVTAPGVSIYSTVADKNTLYKAFSGTSMACPLTAGLAALLVSRDPGAPPESIEACLKASCVNIDSSNVGYEGLLGAGRIDAFEAVRCQVPGPPQPAIGIASRYVCPNAPVHLKDKSRGEVITREWSIPAGIPSAGSDSVLVTSFGALGRYPVTLIVCNEHGCDTTMDTVEVGIPDAHLQKLTFDTICNGFATHAQLYLKGTPPFSVTFDVAGVPFSAMGLDTGLAYVALTPTTSGRIAITAFTDRDCAGSAHGTADVTVTNCSGRQPRQDWTWMFGANAGLDFSSGTPVSVPGSSMYAFEGCSSLSEPLRGQLIAYSNGQTVWNRQHNPMTNGSGLAGHQSSSQTAFFLPMPGSATKYYLFTTGVAAYENGGHGGLAVNVIDMSTSLGEVVEKNRVLIDSTNEAMNAVPHCNGVDTWVITVALDGSKLFAHLVNRSGIAASPVVSPLPWSVDPANIMLLRGSPDGRFFALVAERESAVLVFRFDPASGEADPQIITAISTRPLERPYGVSFSPDSRLLYIATTFAGMGKISLSHLLQYDVTLATDSAIVDSRKIISTVEEFPYGYGSLQLGPDNKLYISRTREKFLDVVEYPNLVGSACSYVERGVYLLDGSCMYGLPNLMDAYGADFSSIARAEPDTTICHRGRARLRVATPDTTWQARWTPTYGLDDPTSRTPVATPDITTSYVLMTWSDGHCPVFDTVTITVDQTCCPFGPPTAQLIAPSIVCRDSQFTVSDTGRSSQGARKLWTFGPDCTPATFEGSNPGYIASHTSGTVRITLTVLDSCGAESDTANVVVVDMPHGLAGADTIVCTGPGDSVWIGGAPVIGWTYRWTPGTGLSDSTASRPLVLPAPTARNYELVVTDPLTGCSSSDTVRVDVRPESVVYVHSSFTPTAARPGQIVTATTAVTTGGNRIIQVRIRMRNRDNAMAFVANSVAVDTAAAWSIVINSFSNTLVDVTATALLPVTTLTLHTQAQTQLALVRSAKSALDIEIVDVDVDYQCDSVRLEHASDSLTLDLPCAGDLRLVRYGAGNLTLELLASSKPGTVTMLIGLPFGGIISPRLYALTGELVRSFSQATLTAGTSAIDLNVGGLASGCYILAPSEGGSSIPCMILGP